MKRTLFVTFFSVITAVAAFRAEAFPDTGRGSSPVPVLLPRARNEPTDHYFRGVTHESAGRLDEAAREYRLVLRRSPAHGDARRRLAEIHLFRGETAEAIVQFRELAFYQENNPLLHYRLARLYESAGNFRKATAEYRKAALLAPDNLTIRRRLARLYAKRKMSGEAAAEYRAILEADPDNIPARNALTALYLRGKKYDELTELLKGTVARKPDDPTGRYKLGLVYEFTKKFDDAEREYGKAVELDAGHAKAMNALARVYLKTGRTDRANEMMEAAAKADPSLKNSALLPRNFDDEFRRGSTVKKKKILGKSPKTKPSKTKTSRKKARGGKGVVSKKKKTRSTGKKVRR